MRRLFRTILLTTISIFSMTLASCSFTFNNLPTSSSGYDYKDTFVNTDGETVHVSLNKSDVYLLPEMQDRVLFDWYKDGEEPEYRESATFSSLYFESENPAIAAVDQKGVITGISVGETRVHAMIFQNHSVGTNCKVHVLEKALTDIEITNAKKTYILNSEFVPRFECKAIFNDMFKEKIEMTNLTIDSSKVNMAVEGNYEISVSYSFGGVSKTAKYTVKVLDNPTYDAKFFTTSLNDVDHSKFWGMYCPKTGNVKTLVIPVWLTDSTRWFATASEKTKVLYDLQTAFYGEGNETTGWNSVKSYYETLSNHTLTYTGKVANWYNAGMATSAVTDSTTKEIFNAAVDWYFSCNPTEHLSDYDSDHNDVVDGIYLIYACEDHPDDNTTFHGQIKFNSSLRPKTSSDPACMFHMWASACSMYTDNTATEVDTHTYIHETGHTFGLEDLYDYGGDIRAIAGGVMMFHNTHEQDPFSMTALNWGKVIVPETSCMIELDEYQSSHTTILLSAHPESVTSQFDEYIMVELYTPTGVNKFDHDNAWKGFYTKGPDEPGIRLWHIDSRLYYKVADEYIFTNDTTIPNTYLAFTNSWGEEAGGHATVLGRDFDDYSLVFELRNSKTISYAPETSHPDCMFSDSTLFHGGDSFSMDEYKSQFKNGIKLNNGDTLGWTINVESIYETSGHYKASISLTYDF